jgi:hypothetical protein
VRLPPPLFLWLHSSWLAVLCSVVPRPSLKISERVIKMVYFYNVREIARGPGSAAFEPLSRSEEHFVLIHNPQSESRRGLLCILQSQVQHGTVIRAITEFSRCACAVGCVCARGSAARIDAAASKVCAPMRLSSSQSGPFSVSLAPPASSRI